MQTSGNYLARCYARAHRGMTLLEIMIVLAIIALVMGIIVGPRIIDGFKGTEVKTTKIKRKLFAYQAYPAWSAAHPDVDCPARLAELDEYTNKEGDKDAWGSPLTMSCGPSLPNGVHGLGVSSAGEDRKDGTSDDLHSWE